MATKLDLTGAPSKGRLMPQGASIGVISASVTAMRSHGELQTWFDPVSGAALQSRRIGSGRDSRMKTHRFLQTGVWRERRTPDASTQTTAPETWPLRSAAQLSYPPDVKREPVITPLMLLSRASALALRTKPGKLDYIVLTDTQVYRVVLESRPDTVMQANVQLEPGANGAGIHGERTVRRVDVRPHLLGEAPEEEPFSLMELEGETALMIDRETGIPLQIQGRWMRVGTVTVPLTRARLRSGCQP
jgi:hypothetical protein